MGLSLNHVKCEVVGLSVSQRLRWSSSGLGIPEVPINEASLLGSPLGEGGVEQALESRRLDLARFVDRLQYLSSHESLFLLRSSLAVPKLLHLLRSSPCFGAVGVASFDRTLRDSLEAISNCSLSDTSWDQASLPSRHGGLGVRSVSCLSS